MRTKAVLFAIALLAAAACGSDATVTSAEPTPTTAPTPTVTPEPPVVATVTTESFTRDWSCGFGFWTSDAAQTVSLLVEFVDFDAANAGQVPEVGNVPSVIWSGRINQGSDLMANWCDDVIEEDEPVAEVTDRWEIVEGSIAIVGTPPVMDCGPLGAVLTDLVAVNDVGDRLDLAGPIEIENTAWGCFAG